MSNSQNGWPVDTTGGQQDRTAVAGVTFPNGVRKGDVAVVLFYVARRFHAEVEPLKKGSCWGWFNRAVRGSASISNHASGTAIDLNADSHPLGAVGTFNSTKRAAIRRILDACDGVVRWGGDYSGRKDEMHFEINRNAASVSALADKIRSGEDWFAMATKADLKAALKELILSDADVRAQLQALPWQYKGGGLHGAGTSLEALGDTQDLVAALGTLAANVADVRAAIENPTGNPTHPIAK
jgi:hypothetical protein